MIWYIVTYLGGLVSGIVAGIGIAETVHGNPEMTAESENFQRRLHALKDRYHANR
jgi:hypothetical protein